MKVFNILLFIAVLILNIAIPCISKAVNDNSLVENNSTIYISNQEELWDLAKRVNEGESFQNYTIELINNIDLKCSESRQWTPIGKNDEYAFKGVFNGNGFLISGMYISYNSENYSGLFGYVEDAKISNVTINGNISGEYKAINVGTNSFGAKIFRSSYAGAIVAYGSNVEIRGCVSNAEINCIKTNSDPFGWKVGGIVGSVKSKSVVSNCINNGNIYCQISQGCIGGICGYNWSSIIKKSINNGNIETKGVGHTGGVVGEMYYQAAKIEGCYNKGNIKLHDVPQGAGGIAGEANVGEFNSCFNVGNIEYLGTNTTNGTASIYNIGGITGKTFNFVTIKNCYNIGNTGTGGGIAGNISKNTRQEIKNNYFLDEKSNYGYYSSGTEDIEIFEKNASQMKAEDFVELLNRENNNYRIDTNNYNNKYPLLVWVNDIKIEQLPSKLSYKQNIDNLNLSGGKIKLLYNYSEYDTVINMDSDIISVNGFENSNEGTIKLNVLYTDEYEDTFEKQFEIEVTNSSLELEASYSTTQLTNKDVLVTITSNKEIKEVEGWTLGVDKKTLTKVYAQNESENVTVFDLDDRSSTIKVSVANIDKIPPKLEVGYESTEPTNQNVVVTITADELVQQVEGWRLLEDRKTLIKNYSENETEEVTVYDLAGNSSTTKVATTKVAITNTEVDKTVSPKVLPNTGAKAFVAVVLILLVFSIIGFINTRRLKDIK